MEEKLTKELAGELMKIEGETRGVVFKTDAEFVLREKGKKGLQRVENELKEIGYPIDYEKIEPMAFYPLGLRALSLLAIQKAFNFSKKDIKRMGALAPKTSFIIRLFTKYFLSVEKTAEKANDIWKRHYTAGYLNAETNEEKRYLVLRLRNLTLHSLFCCYLEGYFSTILRMVVKDPITSEETKCPFKGDKYHEFLFKW